MGIIFFIIIVIIIVVIVIGKKGINNINKLDEAINTIWVNTMTNPTPWTNRFSMEELQYSPLSVKANIGKIILNTLSSLELNVDYIPGNIKLSELLSQTIDDIYNIVYAKHMDMLFKENTQYEANNVFVLPDEAEDEEDEYYSDEGYNHIEWQPIATAPKDGSDILGFSPTDGQVRIYWDEEHGRWIPYSGYTNNFGAVLD